MIHRLTFQQEVPAVLEEVWDYFSTPKNLNEITPPSMHFETIHGGEGKMYPGQLIEYRLQINPLFKPRWLTEIAYVEDKVYFVDKQHIGPYRFWYHEHHFETLEGGTLIRDQITYALPFGPLGDLVNPFWVRPQLNSIFEYRRKKISLLFGAK